MTESVRLEIGEQSLELPVIIGSEGERAVDISKLRGATGIITLDPGYANSGSCTSAITYIDGEAGVLRYRGIPIEELAEKSSFIEVACLLISGQLPSKEALESFTDSIRTHSMLHEDMKRFLDAFPKDAHPMAVCSAAAGALSTFYPDSVDPRDARQVEISVHRLIAKMPTLASYAYKHSIGQPCMYPNDQLSYVGNFLQMMFATPCEPYEPDPEIERVLELLFILQADHEQNCSTSCVRLVGSSMVNLFGAIAAGINALWGPMHSGENRGVIELLESLREEGISGRQFAERVKGNPDSAQLMGFGHRIYRDFDPRARVIKSACFDLLDKSGIQNPLLEIARELEEFALEDDFFIEHGLFPNIEFYTAVIYHAIGIPSDSFTVLSAMGKVPGWIAHWMELHADPAFKIGRPRQIYTGPTERPFVPVDERVG